MTGKKAVNGGGSQDSRSGSIPPPLPPSSDAAIPSSDSLALPGPSSKKLFPLFETKARKNGKATPSVGNSDLESNATLSESSQGAAKPKKKATAAASKGKSKGNGASNSQQSDASTSAKEKGSKPRKASQDKSNQINKSAVKSNKRSKSPRLSIDLEDPNTTISTVASTSTSSTTPPPEPHKTVITITDSPVRELKATKTFADLEAERLAKKAAKEAGGWNGGREPLWPSQATMHVFPHGSMLERRDRPSCARRDWKGKGRAVENDSDYQGKAGVSSDHIRSIVLQYTTFGEHKKHMQIADEADVSEHIRHRLSEPSRNEVSDHAQQCWYMRYAPTKAADVLGDGNRENAMYLRDWLKELTLQDPLKVLQNSRKRKIKREVTLDERKKIRKAAKRRKRKGYDGYADDDLQDFIASDDEEEYEHYDYYDLPDDASVPSPTKSTSSHGSHRRGRFEPLTNVILLAGPVSSGKTSTAYAVANELQWQVFEVYPGIGKRGPKDLDRYVGMVGENHIMKKETPPVSSFFSKAPSRAAASISESSPLPDMEGSGRSDPLIPVTSSDASLLPSAINGSTVKQSCILIEEVDVLFEADSGFWEGLVSFIARSRRPVILTCNDVNAVPKDSLPLQNILYFHALERSIARNLLTEIGHFEGKEVSAQLLDDILDAQTGFSDYSDIRQAINQLQFALTGSCETSRAHSNGLPQVEEHNLRQIESALEIASFADAELVRRSWMAWEDEERVAQPEKDDDELLHHPELPIHKLDPPPELDPNQPLPILAREAEFCEVLGITDDKGENMEILMQHQWTVCSDLQEVAEEYLDDAKLFPDSSVLHTDVLPMLREIVYGDDEQEQAYQIALHLQADDVVLDARVRRSRRLAGSGKEGFRRHLGLSREIANVIRDSGLAVQGIDERLNSEVSNALEYSNQGTNQKELARVNQVVKK